MITESEMEEAKNYIKKCIDSHFHAKRDSPVSAMGKENFMADFNEVVRQIDDSEKNVDKVLKAGRLERHEKKPMSLEQLTLILNYTVGTIAMVLGFGIIYLIIYLWVDRKERE